MNKKAIDKWTILHFFTGIFLTFYFINRGLSIFIAIGILIFFELLEHLIIGDLIFKWELGKRTETPYNTIMDIIVGLIGIILTFILFI